MLTPEQLRNIRDCANDGMPFNANTILMLCDHIDALQAQLQLANDCQEPLFDELAEKQARIAELEQDAANAAAAERERIKKICGDVIDEWFNCAGGADECLRRIEAYEQNGETKP